MDDLSTLLHDAVADVEPADRLAEIRDLTATRPRRIGWYAAGGGVLAVAAAVTAVALLGNQTTTPQADDDPDPLAPTTHAVAVYFVGETPRGARLYREFHQVTGSDLSAALVEITDPDDPDYLTAWEPGQLLGASVQGDVIEVEVDESASTPRDGAAASPLGVEQLIYTVQAAVGERLPVQFVHDGNPVAEVLGVPSSEPLANGDPLDVLSLVSISDPVEGLAVTDSLIARGVASSFEGNVPWRILDADGTLVREGFATAGMEDHLVPWETEPIDLTGFEPGSYTFWARTEGGRPFTDTRTFVVQ